MNPPYTVTRYSDGLPVMNSDFRMRIAAGGGIRARLTLLGDSMHLMPAVIGLLARSPLFIGGGHLVLVRADDASCGAPLFDLHLENLGIQQPLRQTLVPLLDQADGGGECRWRS